MPVKIKVNDRDLECDKGALVIQVAADHGVFIPHFCWHPGLSPEGNCRMCLVKTSTSRKLEPACMMRAADGLVVQTETPEVQKARQDVLEFLLVNHPLDCPICDKSGECLLQDYAFQWRGGLSRFAQDKEVKPTKDLSPGIRFWGNRCITCTRCVRFLQEVPGTGELSVVRRGDHSTIDAFPGVPVSNPMSLNIVDICPVGALINKDFLFQARVWYTRRAATVCASCSRGCNTTVTTLDDSIKRIEPRYNSEVNGHWMCDEGRSDYRYVSSARRLSSGRGDAKEIVGGLRAAGGADSAAAIVSSFNTCEELDLVRAFAARMGIRTIGFLTQSRGERWMAKNGFTIEADKTPNRAYLAKLWGDAAVYEGTRSVEAGLARGTIRGVFVLNGIPDYCYDRKLVEACRKAAFVALVDILKSPMSELAHVLVSGRTVFEKQGTFVNFQGRPQKIREAVRPLDGTRSEVEFLQEMLAAVGSPPATQRVLEGAAGGPA